MTNQQTKPLTAAQRKALIERVQAAQYAQAQVDLFVAYLREEHSAPHPDWEIRDPAVGFVCLIPQDDKEGGSLPHNLLSATHPDMGPPSPADPGNIIKEE